MAQALVAISSRLSMSDDTSEEMQQVFGRLHSDGIPLVDQFINYTN